MKREAPKAVALLIAVQVVLHGTCACESTAGDVVRHQRARELGIIVGELSPGPRNAITDVPGVKVGHTTIREGADVRTGVTAIVPHGGDVFVDKLPAAFACYNGFGKPFGTVQINELGQLETPILLGSTLSVPRIADAVLDYVLGQDRTGAVRSVNPAVGETNDGFLSDGRARPIRSEHVRRAIESATDGAVREGSVGAGTGTVCMGYKGGIGTSSRQVRIGEKTWTVGVVVQTNFGGDLTIVGRRIPTPSKPSAGKKSSADGDGSCAIVLATDAPLNSRQLKRLARRTFAGMARAGANFSHGSGDYTFAFSTRSRLADAGVVPLTLRDDALSGLLRASADATQEAIYNSLLRATTVTGRNGHRAVAVDLDLVRRVLGKPPTSN